MLTARLTRIKMEPLKLERAARAGSVRPLDKATRLVEAEAKALCPFKTGKLRASISTARVGDERIVGPTEKYGADFEHGTRLRPRRPFMWPGLLRASRRMPALWRNSIRK